MSDPNPTGGAAAQLTPDQERLDRVQMALYALLRTGRGRSAEYGRLEREEAELIGRLTAD